MVFLLLMRAIFLDVIIYKVNLITSTKNPALIAIVTMMIIVLLNMELRFFLLN